MMGNNIIALAILIPGMLLCASIFIQIVFSRFNIPVILGYILLGVATKILDSYVGFLEGEVVVSLNFLTEIGIILLLFHVGLISNVQGLLKQLPSAIWIWFWNVTISGTLGFLVSTYLFNMTLISAIFVAIALTATSIGISISLWEENKILETKEGQLLLDIAELDDLSSIGFLAMLISIIPMLSGNVEVLTFKLICIKVSMFITTFVIFAASCFLFSFKIEPYMSRYIMIKKTKHESMMFFLGICFIISAVAEYVGLSLAIGAFFAGLALSRDPEMVKNELKFTTIYEFFVPFFFIGVGLNILPVLSLELIILGIVLLLTAVIGKVLGTVIPAIPIIGLSWATIIGVSMIPRAEIAMIVMQKGLSLGTFAVTSELYSAMVVVVIGSSIIAPLILKYLLSR